MQDVIFRERASVGAAEVVRVVPPPFVTDTQQIHETTRDSRQNAPQYSQHAALRGDCLRGHCFLFHIFIEYHFFMNYSPCHGNCTELSKIDVFG